MPGGETYQFGPFALEPSERRLLNNEQFVPLAPKAFDVLVVLVRNAGRLVTKRELLDSVWNGSFVEEGILAVHISALRKALASGLGEPACIETVVRSGYRFNAAVTVLNETPRSITVLPARPFTTELFSARDQSLGLAFSAQVADGIGRSDQLIVRPFRAMQSSAAADPASAGRALHVDAIVDSQFLRSSDRMRVAVRLIRSSDGVCLWNADFDEPATDLVAISDAIAGSVLQHLGLRSQSQAITSQNSPHRSPVTPDVHELLGRGRAHLMSASMFEVPKAIEAFQAAVERAPAYAQAHAALAMAHCAQAEFRVVPHGEAYAAARSAALRALAEDPMCGDAQVALGAVLFFADWDWTAAAKCLERALEVHPNHTEAYLLYGRVLDALGRGEEALAAKLKALERDPFSPLVHLQIAMSYWNQRRYDESIQWAQKALAVDPRHPHAREHLAGAYLKKGDSDAYMREVLRHAEAHGTPREALEPLERAYSTGGRPGVVKLVLETSRAQPQLASAIMLAVHYAEAGDVDSAFEHLDVAIENRDPALVYLAVGPQWDDLRRDSRFEQRLARLRLDKTAASGRHAMGHAQ